MREEIAITAAAVPEMTRILAAANRELSAFLSAVSRVFGDGVVRRAADCCLSILKTMESVDTEWEDSFRQITIRATSHLTASTMRPSGSKPAAAEYVKN